MFLAHGHNAVAGEAWTEAPQSGVKHSTTEPLCFRPKWNICVVPVADRAYLKTCDPKH